MQKPRTLIPSAGGGPMNLSVRPAMTSRSREEGTPQPKETRQTNLTVTTEKFNCITKFAFATSVGH
jgi:hypothetical protein